MTVGTNGPLEESGREGRDRTPASPPVRRPSSEEREAAIAQLSGAFARDLLTLEQFEERADDVYRASSPAALTALTADLPGTVGPRTSAIIPREEIPPRVSAVLSSVERGGPLVVPSRLEIRSRLGHVALDLRRARFTSEVTEIAVRALMGNVEVRLPEGVIVEHHGSAFLGSFATRATGDSRFPARTDAPTVRITGRAVLSNVEFESGAG